MSFRESSAVESSRVATSIFGLFSQTPFMLFDASKMNKMRVNGCSCWANELEQNRERRKIKAR